MQRRKKSGNYSVNDRRLILQAATSPSVGLTIGEKQEWLMKQGVHRPGHPTDPVSESAIKYWANTHRKLQELAMSDYEDTMHKILTSPPSYRALKQLLTRDKESS